MQLEGYITSSLDAATFEQYSGLKYFAGASRFRNSELNLQWVKTGPMSGRWMFEANGRKFSCKNFTPRFQDVQMYTPEDAFWRGNDNTVQSPLN